MSAPDAAVVFRRLAAVIDGHRWTELADLLAPDFLCSYVHSGERFDRDAWVRLNADYPGFQDFVVEDVVAAGERVAVRARVTGSADGRTESFGVAVFGTVRDGLISRMTEVWTDIGETVPADRRP